MIFLLNDGTCRVQDPTPYNDAKTAKYHRKYGDRLTAVLIESMTRLRSDCYVLVRGDRFKSSIEPFKLTYSIALFNQDMPISDENTLTRTLDIDNVYDYYNAISLMYQLIKIRELCDALHFYDIVVSVVRVTLRTKAGDMTWTCDDADDLKEFLDRQDMRVDTDEFMDARIPRTEMIEKGFYHMEMHRGPDGEQQLAYYIHDARRRLHIKGRQWELVDKLPLDFPEMTETEIYGTCINDTGLLYAATKPIALRLERVQSCEVLVFYGTFEEFDGIRMTVPLEQPWEYSAYNELDILYTALYVPQILDFQKAVYLTDDKDAVPVKIDIEILTMRHYLQRLAFEVDRVDPNQGITLDLFGMIAAVLVSDWNDISRADL